MVKYSVAYGKPCVPANHRETELRTNPRPQHTLVPEYLPFILRCLIVWFFNQQNYQRITVNANAKYVCNDLFKEGEKRKKMRLGKKQRNSAWIENSSVSPGHNNSQILKQKFLLATNKHKSRKIALKIKVCQYLSNLSLNHDSLQGIPFVSDKSLNKLNST